MTAHILLLDDDTTVGEMMHLALSAEGGYLVSPSERVFDDLADVERLRPEPLHSGWEDEDRRGRGDVLTATEALSHHSDHSDPHLFSRS